MRVNGIAHTLNAMEMVNCIYNVQVNNYDKLCDLLNSLHGLLEDYKKGVILTIVCFGGDIYILYLM